MSSRAATDVAAATRIRRTAVVGVPWGIAVPVGLGGLVFWLGYNGGSYNLQSWTKVAIVVWWASFIGVAAGIWPQARIGRTAAASVSLVAAFAAFAGLSAVWASSADGAVEAMARGFLYCGVLTLAFLVCTRGLAARSSDGIALGLVAIALLAGLSRFFPSLFPADTTLHFLPDAHTRLNYPVNYWNGLAVLVALACPLLLRIAVCGRSSFARAAALAPFPAIAAVVYLSSSRSGAVTAGAGSVAFVLLTGRKWRATAAAAAALAGSIGTAIFLAQQHQLVNGPLESSAAHDQGRVSALVVLAIAVGTSAVYGVVARRLDRVRMPRFAGRVAVGVVVLALVAGIVAAHPVARWHSFTSPPTTAAQQDEIKSHFLSTSGNWRWQYWQSAFDEWKSRPLIGRGAGSYETWWAQHGTRVGFVSNAHSLYAETAGELGLVGLGLIVGALALGALAGIRRALGRRDALGDSVAAAAAAGFVAYMIAAGIDWMWQLPAVSIVGFVLLGLAVGPATDPETRAASTPRARRTIRMAVVLAAVTALAIEADVLIANLKINDSQAAVVRGDIAAARNAAGDARSLQPWSSVPYVQRALVDEASGQLTAARTAIRSAIDRDRANWRLWLIESRIEEKLGNRAAAQVTYERARSLNPRSSVFAGVATTGATPLGPLVTAIHDPLHFPHPQAGVEFARSRAAGATVARILIHWSAVAPRAPSSSSDPADPGNPAYDWTTVDREVKLAVNAGLEPILDIYDPPLWARKPLDDGRLVLPQLRDPAGDFGKFMLAAARRYSGKGLPRVRYWQVWNEPNLSFYLDPQYVNGQPASPAIYREMVNAAADAVHSVRADNLLIAGGQAPFAHGSPTKDPAQGQVALAPMQFMRELLCMSADQPPRPTCDDQVKFDVWSHHPYTAGGPGTRAKVAGDVSLGDLPDMKALLDAAAAAHHVVSRGPVRFWITEISWDSKPPDTGGVPVALEAQWISEALYDMWTTGISLVAWYLIQDGDPAQQSAQSGLYSGPTPTTAKPKTPMLTAFRFPFVGHVVGGKISVWGRTPWGKPGRVLVEESRTGGWKRLGIVEANRYGIFTQTFGAPQGKFVRARVLGKGGLPAVPFPLAGPRNIDVNPFGASNGTGG